MSLPDVYYRTATATQEDILSHLRACSENFTPRLSERVGLEQYSRKLAEMAVTFEAWQDDTLVGLVAAYFNDETSNKGFISSVSTVGSHMGRGISKELMQRCLEHGQRLGFREISLEVHRESNAAIQLYRRCGFVDAGSEGDTRVMTLTLATERPNG